MGHLLRGGGTCGGLRLIQEVVVVRVEEERGKFGGGDYDLLRAWQWWGRVSSGSVRVFYAFFLFFSSFSRAPVLFH
jgi:hypothetical protein